jgi:hypothetical protein
MLRSEVNPRLRSHNERIADLARAAGAKDVLQVWLNKYGTLVEVGAIGQFDRCFAFLDADRGIEQLRSLLCLLQIVAEAAVHDAQRDGVHRP